MTKTMRLVGIIASIAILVSALLGTGAFFLVNHLNNSKATTTGTSSMANIYNTDGTINSSAVEKLLTAVGYSSRPTDTGTYTAHNIAGRTSNNSGATIIFPMGYYVSKAGVMDTSKPIYWQAVYLSNGYLTIWMNNSYTIDYYNNSATTVSGWGNGTSYSQNSNYSKSTLRDVANNIYTAISGKLTSFSLLIKSPSEANATWQQNEAEDVYTGTSSYYEHHNNLYYSSTSSYGGSFTRWSHSLWDFDNQPYNDKFWMPSSAEIFNNVSESSNKSLEKGIWGLTAADRGFKSTNSSEAAGDAQTPLDGKNSTSSCWLRSGFSGNLYNGDRGAAVASSGSASNSYVNQYAGNQGIRPAAHLSLSTMAAVLSSTITFDRQGGSGGMSSVTVPLNSAMPTVTPPTRTGHTFRGYFTGTNGTGTQYYTASGTSARNWDIMGDTTLYAYWTINKYKIVFNSNNSNYGSILNLGGSIDYGTVYIAGAVPKQNCAFLYWIDSSAPNVPIYDNPLTITVTGDKTYTAYFTNSLVDGVSCVATSGGEARIVGYEAGDTTVTFIAVAYAGYKFDGWFVQGENTALSADLSCVLSMSAVDGKIVVARFSKISANINDDTDNTNEFY